MGIWGPLPEGLPAEVVHFVEQLRVLKDRTGLSLVSLGARTAYSKSSWQRYLNGQQPPPRQAVLALCRVAGLDAPEAARFGARWELAVRAWPRPENQEGVRGAGADSVRGAGADCVREDRTAGGSESAAAAKSPWEELDEGDEDEDTLPWWVPQDEPQSAGPGQAPEPGPSWRVLAYTAAAVIVILLAGLLLVVTREGGLLTLR